MQAKGAARSLGVMAGTLVVYALAFRWLYDLIGVRAQVLTVVPLILGGALLGVRGAIGTWLVTACIRLAMLHHLGVQSWWQFGGDAIGAMTGLVVGVASVGSVQLLLTDVIMPETSGKELADLVRAARPEVRVLFMSGYTADVLGRHGVLESGVEFMEKPFSADTLARRIREVLDA
jgi:CheY-like chemotaxis protein